MTPKEKSEELMRKFYYGGFSKSELNNHFSKLTAIKVVDEILNVIEDERAGFNWKTYYLEVKQEIEKL
jgi:hypothetical protein